MNSICKQCGQAVQETFYFCPNCGKKIQEPFPSTSLSTQVVIYLVSFFLAPFGISHIYKYFRYGDQKGKYVAATALILTLIAVYIEYSVVKSYLDGLKASLEAINGII